MVILNGVMAVFTLGLMFLYSPQLSLIVLATLALYILIRWVAYYQLRNATEENIVHAAKQSSYFMETVRGIRTVNAARTGIPAGNSFSRGTPFSTNSSASDACGMQ